MSVQAIEELIDQLTFIKSKFKSDSFTIGASYDWKTHQRKNISMSEDVIYKDPDFLKWKERLLYELRKIEASDSLQSIIHDLEHFVGVGDRTRFDRLEAKLLVLKEHLSEYSNSAHVTNDSRIPEPELIGGLQRTLSKLQRNHSYNSSSSEDTMNDYVRDLLDESYIVYDQTRQGDSVSGKDAGEVDIQIRDNGMPIVMIEGIKLASLDKDNLEVHINKVLKNYDPNGCPYAVLLIYATMKKFDDFYHKLFNFLQNYDFPFSKESNLEDVDLGYGELKHAQIVLNRNGQNIRAHFFAAHII